RIAFGFQRGNHTTEDALAVNGPAPVDRPHVRACLLTRHSHRGTLEKLPRIDAAAREPGTILQLRHLVLRAGSVLVRVSPLPAPAHLGVSEFVSLSWNHRTEDRVAEIVHRRPID